MKQRTNNLCELTPQSESDKQAVVTNIPVIKAKETIITLICTILLYNFITDNIIISTIGGWICMHLLKLKKLIILLFAIIITIAIFIDYSQSKTEPDETHVNKTFRIIGGMPQSIDWLERGFKMDIFPDSFPLNESVSITIIIHHSYPANAAISETYTPVTENYEIESTHQPSGAVFVHMMKHDVIHGDNASFYLVHQHDDNNIKKSPIENISTNFLSFKVDSFSCCFVMCSNCTIKYGASFYARKTSSHVQVQVVLNSFKDKMKDNKYSKWIKEPISPLEIHHNVTVTTEVELEPSGYGCLTKLENHSYTMIIDDDPKEEFSFHFKWNSSCPWWDLWSSQKSSTWIDVHIKDNKPTTAMIFLEMLSVEFDLQTSLLNLPWYTIIIVPAFTVIVLIIVALITNKLGIDNQVVLEVLNRIKPGAG